jgi:hypothetical protein
MGGGHNRDLEKDDHDLHHLMVEPRGGHEERCWALQAGVGLLARRTRVLGAAGLGRDSRKRLLRTACGRRKSARANEIYLEADRGHSRSHYYIVT